jgi:serine/threonine protein phosphatase PrpC
MGNVRNNNEDNYNLFGNYRENVDVQRINLSSEMAGEPGIAAVFDGMGGEEYGEIASLIVAKNISPCKLENVESDFTKQIQSVNALICNEMKRRGGKRMGTTLTALIVDNDKAISCNIGDSRCYLMRNNKLTLLSLDHTKAQQLVDLGMLEPKKARISQGWHVLTQHIGICPDEFIIEPYFSGIVELFPNDMFLLCSDGLTDMLLDEEISDILARYPEPEEAGNYLVKEALHKGGRDNVTVIVLKVEN